MKKEDIRPFDDNGLKHGYWEQYHDNGLLWFKGNWIHGRPHGYWEVYWEEYWYNDNLYLKAYYIHGKAYGLREAYYANEEMISKEYYIK